jgi:DNA mismatch endonuclease (patch repair protein)
MVDTVAPEVRSRMMAAVKSRDTKPEIEVRKALHALGFRYRVHAKVGNARPDVVLPKHRAAVFVHGCFWHAHNGCRHARMPASNVGFWREKMGRNVARDARNLRELGDGGWRVAVVWECGVRAIRGDEVARRIADWLANGGEFLEIGAEGVEAGGAAPPRFRATIT